MALRHTAPAAAVIRPPGGAQGYIQPKTTANGSVMHIVHRHTAVSVNRGIPIKIIKRPRTLWRAMNRSMEVSI